ncbi:MAG: 30S ribosomal protein S6 [Alphaproteobacteria bacterium]|nr:30S ribosomal protein S6 [Alphaproteobacteria bacterium]
MSLYETIFITRQEISQAQAEALADQFAGTLTAQGGKVVTREYWGLRNIAYRIKKNRKGHYLFFRFDAPSAALLEMERTMRINEDVIRLMSVVVDEHEEGPSVMMRKSHRRDGSDFDEDERPMERTDYRREKRGYEGRGGDHRAEARAASMAESQNAEGIEE